MTRRLLIALGLSVTTAVSLGANGCGGQQATRNESHSATSPPAPPAKEAGGAQPDRTTEGEPAASPTSPTRRKIIYTGTVEVVVNDLDAARAEVDKLLAKYEGYVAKSEVKNDTGTRRTATYTLRVPVEGFRPLVDGLLGLGTADRTRSIRRT
ncbi:MAG: hypothetical protein JWO38_3906 [Gemmataceae bacterium]|nr:hypothetical protein [Gemmataceae bacterium]